MVVTDLKGTRELLSLTRQWVGALRRQGRLREVKSWGKTYIPIADIAEYMGFSQKKILDMADSEDIPTWNIKGKK